MNERAAYEKKGEREGEWGDKKERNNFRNNAHTRSPGDISDIREMR
jgi:hypothetical protein